jgi:glucokinase
MLAREDQIVFGIEIGGTKLQIVAADGALHITRRWRADVNPGNGAAGIREQLAQGLNEMCDECAPAAVGVGFGGPIDWRTGRIARSHQIEGWSGFDLAGWIGQIAKAPVVVDNDANVGALGEALAGAGVGQNPVFYVTLGSGVGGGLVIDGRIYHGAPPGEAEFGHLRLDRASSTVESRCSGWAIDTRIRELRQSRPQSILAKMLPERSGGEARYLSSALSQNDPAAVDILNELGEDLAFALSHAVHLFHPAIAVLGGGLSQLGEPLRQAVAERLPQFLMRVFAPGPTVVLAKLGEDAVPIGAAYLAQRSVEG